jgi:hypothetical protein
VPRWLLRHLAPPPVAMHAMPSPPCVLRTGVICAAKAKLGRDANSALNRGVGAGEDTYLRMAQLLGYEEVAARQALRSAPVRDDRDAPNEAVESAVGQVQRYEAPTYSQFEAALKGSGFRIKKLPAHNIAQPKASDRGGLRRRPDGMWRGETSSTPAEPPAASTSSSAPAAPGAAATQPASQPLAPPAAARLERPEVVEPPPTKADFARLLAASGVRVTALDKDDDDQGRRKSTRGVPAGTVRLQFGRRATPDKVSGPAPPAPTEPRRQAAEPKMKPAERRAQQQRRAEQLMTPLLQIGATGGRLPR